MASGQDQVQQPRPKARSAQRRYEDYRRAFLLLLKEPFDDLDRTVNRMLEVLATTLDASRVSFWVFDEQRDCIRCEHFFSLQGAGTLGPPLLHRSDCPAYFGALCQELVVAAHDARTDPRTAELLSKYLEPTGVYSMLDVPVRAFGRYVGVLCHEQVAVRRDWTTQDADFASGVAMQIALAFERDRSHRAQAGLLQRSLHDDDTRLPNRLQLEEALSAYLHNPARSGALAVASIDQYNFVAASLGMRRMQSLLRQFGARLMAAAPDGTLVARIATNEFALLLRGVDEANLLPIAEQVNAAAKLAVVNEGQRLFFTLSTGVAPIDRSPQQSAESLIAEAQLASHRARDGGGDRVAPFTAEMRNAMRNRISMEQDLRRALDAAEFDLHYQPIEPILGTGARTGADEAPCVEALLRWRHPRLGVLAPPAFMNVALESGVMLELGRRVLSAACASIAKARTQPGLADLNVTINMSAPELLLPGTADDVGLELKRHGLPPQAVTLEITETALMLDLQRAADALTEIRALGVSISLDDFGTAYSSLSWLRQLPIDKIKLDRSYVAGMVHEPRDLAIVKTIVELAKVSSRDVVAEGVETEAQLRILSELSVPHAQGFLFAAPEPLEKFTAQRLRSLVPTAEGRQAVLVFGSASR